MTETEYWNTVLVHAVKRARRANTTLRILRHIERNTPTSDWVLRCDEAFLVGEIQEWMHAARNAKRELGRGRQLRLTERGL